MGPWHHVARRSSGLVTLLVSELAAPREAALEWIRLGSVSVDGARASADVAVPSGAKVTVFREPRRFPAAFGEWTRRPVVDREDFAIFAKPHDVPTIATADNGVENAIAALEAAHQRRFYVTHRLDSGAAGLLAVAKTPIAQADLDRRFREREIEKTYLALAPRGLAPGTYRHFLAPGVPRQVAATGEEAELVVEAADDFAADRYPKALAEYRIRLVTGRTHQIRAQFAALGFPLTGDRTYGGKGGLPRPLPRRAFALVATGLHWDAVRAEIPATWRAVTP